MKKVVLFLFAFIVTAAAAWAQEISVKQVGANGNNNTSENPNTIAQEDLINEFSELTSVPNLMQTSTDANNFANINIVGNYNSASITQNGSNITGAINIDGFDRNNVAISQTGNNLLSFITVEGASNSLSMDQEGSNLGNLVQVQGSGMNIGLEQNTGGFRYRQVGNVNPIEITSTSNYVPIVINNN